MGIASQIFHHELSASIVTDKEEPWSEQLDVIRSQLGAPRNPLLFPPYYLKAAFRKIGGRVALIEKDQKMIGAAFLFPRSLDEVSKVFTLRYHQLGNEPVEPNEVIKALTPLVQEAPFSTSLIFYDPRDAQQYQARDVETTQLCDGSQIDIHTPTAPEADEIRNLQMQTWDSLPDELYPADIHSANFRLATSLVASSDSEIIGFLFGFYRLGGPQLPEFWSQSLRTELRVQSQMLAVSEKYRKLGIAFYLKKAQAKIATDEEIEVIHWTVDPLQYPNAVLNFGKLKAVAFTFYRNYYELNNLLNRVLASRLEITWLPSTDRVTQGLSDPSSDIVDLSKSDCNVTRVNSGPREALCSARSPRIAIEIPSNWTELQTENASLAAEWRESTDRLFEHYLGSIEGKYMITAVGREDNRKYLIADRIDSNLITTFITSENRRAK